MPREPLTSETTTSAPTSPAAHPPAAAERLGEPTGHPSGLAIIASKISPAVEGRLVLTRARLVGWLEQQAHARVILLTAEAGYGKSTLLNDFARRSDLACIWYRLETSDGDWITFLSYMVASLRGAVPGFGLATEALLRNVAAMGSSRELVLAQFLSDLGEVGSSELLVILDDYHLVGESADVRMIVGRLIDRAPEGMRFVLAGRGRPNLAFGRMIAQGRVAELTTQDLRFSRPEIEELFATAYLQPLDQRAREVVAERTQGWAASLQLVAASIAVSRPSEVASFIEALSGATGPIYDFLAEEVLARMAPLTERVLLHASLLDRVTPELVTAGLSVSDEPIDRDMVAAHLEDARSLGLLGEAEAESGGARIHPLFRELLEHHLGQLMPPEHIMAMHAAIARCAEGTAWLASAKHYALADMERDAMRVLGSAASEALGTGGWGAVVEVVALMPDATPPPAVEVIKARALTSDGRPEDALAMLSAIDLSNLSPDERGLVSLARASALQMAGHSEQLWQEVEAFGSLVHSDGIVNLVARAWTLMRTACRGGSISDARRSLDLLAGDSGRAGLHHFAGIALHNAATAALAQGDFEGAASLAVRARETLSTSPVNASIRPSSLVTQALAAAELGNLAQGVALAQEAVAVPYAHPDVLADSAYLAAVCGDIQRAESLEHRLHRVMSSGPAQVGSRHQAAVARVTRLIAAGRFEEAQETASQLTEGRHDELDGVSRSAFLVALLSSLNGLPSAQQDVLDALRVAEAQRAWRWEFRLRILESVVCGDGASLARRVLDCSEVSALGLLEMADVIGASLHLLDPVPAPLTHSISHFPARWRSVLVRQLGHPSCPSAPMAAKLLADVGSREDASHLVAWERRVCRPGRKAQLGRALVRRISPTLRIHDLGRTTYEVSGIEFQSTAARRKALALPLYLVTRPKQTAAREQVMEALWPNQSPSSAVNSLHQTLHYVRRNIAPWLGHDATPDYVPLDSELIYLDPELVQVDSIAFMRQATEALNSADLSRTGPSITRLYTGRFAPEFEYEDWAEDWRTLVHAQFLHLSQATAAALLAGERVQTAIDVLSRAIELDPLALNLRASLVRTLARVGAADAAADHYRQYANLMKRETGVRAPPFETLVSGEP